MTHHKNEDDHPGHEAHETSRTRFGPRPVPQGQRQVGPDLSLPRRVRPGRPGVNLTSVVVWGGVGIMAAAATAGAVMATRKVAEAIAGGDEDHVARPGPGSSRFTPSRRGPTMAPRFADLSEDERERVRRRVRARAAAERAATARMRAEAAGRAEGGGRREERRSLVGDLTTTANNLSNGLNGVLAALSAAVAGFRSVANQADGIIREFSATADTVREVLDRATAIPRRRGEGPASDARGKDEGLDRMHRL